MKRLSVGLILNLGHDYDDPDFEWWEIYGKHPLKGFKRQMAKKVKELAGDGDSIISLGCGSSPILNMFHCRRVGVDISKGKLEFFQNHTDALLIEADITKMDPIGEFDIVLLNEVIEHVGCENVDRVLRLVKDSLSPSGRAVISMPDISSRLGRLVEIILHKGIHSSLMTGADLLERCKNLGLVCRDRRNFLWDTAFLFTREVR